MKKITYLFASLIMVVLIVSCSKDTTNDDDAMLKKAVATGPSNPVSDAVITPYIIPGVNNGGNRTCAEVAAWKGLSANYFYCGYKFDFTNGAFASAFPSGIDVTVTAAKYVTFEMDDCIQFGDKFYKVGAVIVKGSNAANVYFYPKGTLSDSGLASPINASGGPAGLSNLTFCFVECEKPEWVIALKAQMTFPGMSNSIGVSGGIDSDINEYHIGYNPYVLGQINTYPLMNNFVQIGTITASDFSVDGEQYLRIVIDTDNSDWGFWYSYLYVGTLAGFNTYRTPWYDDRLLVDYELFPFQKSTVPEPCIFEIPFSSITE